MGNSKKKKENKQNVNTEKLIKLNNRNQSISKRGSRSYFPNRSEFSRQGTRDVNIRNQGYGNYGAYSSYSRYKFNHSPNVRFCRNKPYRKPPSRPVSPVLGSEEYMVRKIQQTSAIIMKQLLNPDEQIIRNENQTHEENKGESSKHTYEQNTKISEKPETISHKNKTKRINSYNIEEIHTKIMNHISNLNDGRKKNLINSDISGYDVAIQQIQKQKRLEISRALRDMCSKSNPNQTQESSDLINSIIPDMGIKIEDIPHDLIEELRNTLNLEEDYGVDDSEHSAGERIDENQTHVLNMLNTNSNFLNEMEFPITCIKPEPIEENTPHLIEEKANSSKHEDNNGKNSHDANNGDNNLGDSVGQAENEVLNTGNNLIDERIHHLACVKLEPADVEQPFLFMDEVENCNENKEKDDHSSHDINNSIQVIENNLENNHVIIRQDAGSENINNSLLHETTHPLPIKLELIDEPHLFTKEEVYRNENNDEVQINHDANSSENMKTSAVKIKQITECDNLSRSPCSKKGQPEESIENVCTLRNQNNTDELKNTNCGNISVCISRPTLQNANIATQTEEEHETAEKSIESFLIKHFKQSPGSISEAISRMRKIDQCILKLTTYRQSLFNNFEELDKSSHEVRCNKTTNNKQVKAKTSINKIPNLNISPLKRKIDRQMCKAKKKKKPILIEENKKEIIWLADDVQKKNEEVTSLECGNFVDVTSQRGLLKFQDLREKMLVLKVVEDKLVAATESGKIFFCSLEDGHFIKTIEVCKGPITSLLFINTQQNYIQMFIGSFDSNLKQITIYKFQSHCEGKNVYIDDGIQCMETKWNYIFIGGIRGSILRYSLKNTRIEYSDKFSNNSIFVLKATQEGARRVLLIGSRNSPICIRDAMTGLHMRIMENQCIISPTVYSVILEKNLVYCGTTNHDILVYSFHDGRLIHRHKAVGATGISCMKLVKNLLFASCHNGRIYVYDTKGNAFIGSIEGPGGVILSMEVLENQVIVGTMSFKFTSVLIPYDILRYKSK